MRKDPDCKSMASSRLFDYSLWLPVRSAGSAGPGGFRNSLEQSGTVRSFHVFRSLLVFFLLVLGLPVCWLSERRREAASKSVGAKLTAEEEEQSEEEASQGSNQ